MARPIRSSRSGSKVAPRAIDTGKQVAGPITHPRGPSEKWIPGIPSRSTTAAGQGWPWYPPATMSMMPGPEFGVAVEAAELLFQCHRPDQGTGFVVVVGTGPHPVGGLGERRGFWRGGHRALSMWRLTICSSSSWRPERGTGRSRPRPPGPGGRQGCANRRECGRPAGRPMPRSARRGTGRSVAASSSAAAASKRAGDGVDPADVGVEEVVAVHRLAAQLGVEVEAAGGEAAGLQDLVQRQRAAPRRVFGNWSVSQPFCGSPRLASIDAEEAVGRGRGDLVLEAVPGQGGVVGLDVELDLAVRPYWSRKACTAAASWSYWCLVGSSASAR